MVEILKTSTQLTTFYKVKAHINIEGNERADKLAKIGARKIYSTASEPYKYAHTTPFYIQKDI
jgi:ribonuclease HI